MRLLPALLAPLLAALTAFASPAAARAADLAAVPPVRACESLAAVDLSAATGARTTQTAQRVEGAKPYCKVSGTIAPAVRFEVRLPMQGWTQRYLQTGCGGLCGMLYIDAAKSKGCLPVTEGEIVLASTDMGHAGQDMAWGTDPARREDFAHRGVHVTALAAKALIAAFYGRAPRYSYFSGCSDGGREALIAAQRHPEDFDGIAAGAPALNFTVQNSFYHAWMALSNTGPDGQALLTTADLPVLHAAALKACDALDGLADGQIDDPRRCRFDPGATLCQGEARPGQCLTAAQVEAARKLYAGPHTTAGRPLAAGSVQPGSELAWGGVFVPQGPRATIFSAMIALQAINGLLLTPNPAPPLALADWKFDEATFRSLEPARRLYNADDPDLSRFAAHGGKLILWHGWSDPHISPLNTIDYFDRVGQRMGAARRDRFLRMFLFPAMYHCAGGDGPSDFPLLERLMAWVERGEAPAALIAHRAAPNGAPVPDARSRPVYPYPAVARYAGTGSIDDAANFRRAAPDRAAAPISWIGSR